MLDAAAGDGSVVRLNGVDLFVRRLGDPALPALVAEAPLQIWRLDRLEAW